jgi:hypothetical protein
MTPSTPTGRSRIARGIWLVALIAVGGTLATSRHPGPARLAGGLAILYLAPWSWALLRSSPSARPITIRFIACTLAIAFGIAVFEVPALLRIVDYRALFATPTVPWLRSGNRPDPELIHIKKGHQQVRESFTGNEVHWLRDAGPSHVYRSDRRYDRDGFRNPRDADKADVIVLGDSFIEGAHVTADELITARLAAELGGNKTVANLGQAGYGPEQELHALRRFGIARRPSVCVWAFYEGNDLADIDEYKSQRSRLQECRRTGQGLSPSVSERSFTANALGFVLRAWIDPLPRRPASPYRGWFTNDRGTRLPIYFASGDHRRESPRPGSLDRLREILREAHALCRARGIKLIVMFIPTKLRVYRPVCTFEPGSVCATWPVDDLPRIIGRLVAGISPDLDYLDLTPRFQAEAVRGALLYLADDTHWSAAGHHFAAKTIVGVPCLGK